VTRVREPVGWFLFLVVATIARLPKWIAGPGVIEARIASLSWLERRPAVPDYAPDDVDDDADDFERRTW